MSWQPIETAPKDGTHILLRIPDFDYDQRPKAPTHVVTEGYWKLHGWPDGGYWEVIVLPSHGCDCCAGDNQDPTHWMPLPEKPQ